MVDSAAVRVGESAIYAETNSADATSAAPSSSAVMRLSARGPNACRILAASTARIPVAPAATVAAPAMHCTHMRPSLPAEGYPAGAQFDGAGLPANRSAIQDRYCCSATYGIIWCVAPG